MRFRSYREEGVAASRARGDMSGVARSVLPASANPRPT